MPRVKKPMEPWEMTPAQLEEELDALIKRQAWLENQPKCARPSCDGKPHAGAPYPHDPTYRQAADPLESAQQLDEAYAGRPTSSTSPTGWPRPCAPSRTGRTGT